MNESEKLKQELKDELSECNHINDGSLAAHVNENIQWAWDNWSVDLSDYYYGEKPERYTSLFRDEWIDNEPFDEQY
jgi:hypothetical protein